MPISQVSSARQPYNEGGNNGTGGRRRRKKAKANLDQAEVMN